VVFLGGSKSVQVTLIIVCYTGICLAIGDQYMVILSGNKYVQVFFIIFWFISVLLLKLQLSRREGCGPLTG
jgi:hypothetical protein